MTLNLEETEKLARAANQKWGYGKSEHVSFAEVDKDEPGTFVSHGPTYQCEKSQFWENEGDKLRKNTLNDMCHIGNMSPERTLAMVARIRELETSASGREETNRQVTSELVQLVKERDEALARIRSFEKERAFLQSQREKMERVKNALRCLRNETKGTLSAHELAIRYDAGNSNWKCLEMALDMADEALKLLGEA